MNLELKSKKIMFYTGMVSAVLLGLLPFLMNASVTAVAQNEAIPAISEEQAITIATGQEVGENDFRISSMGEDDTYDADFTAVAYNTQDNEYLVIWAGDDDRLGLADDEYEIFGQRVDAATGLEVGNDDFRISDMGPVNDANYDAVRPDVAYDSNLNQYLVVWEGDDNTSPLANGDFEIFGQLLAADGSEIGSNDFRISNMGIQDGNTNFPASDPAVTYNPTAQEYLVVWEGVILTLFGTSSAGEIEIFGQRIEAATGTEVGTNDFRISDMGPQVDGDYGAFDPAVTYNSVANQYLVVWEGDDTLGSLAEDEFEIFGQTLQADGTELGSDFRISSMGPDGNPSFDASVPRVIYQPQSDRYMVIWRGNNTASGDPDPEYEIIGRELLPDGTKASTNNFRISDMGRAGVGAYDAVVADVACQATAPQCLVVWEGDDDVIPLVDEEFEIFSQLIQVDGTESGPNDHRLSKMGDDKLYDAFNPAVAYNTKNNEYLVVWTGDDNSGELVDNEREIFGRRVSAETGQPLGGEIRISDMGPDGDANYDAFDPAVTYNPVLNQYLVVWEGDADFGTPSSIEREIFGQLLQATGLETGDNDFRISDMGPSSDDDYEASDPAVAYNPTINQYLIVWEGEDDISSPGNMEREIYGQLLQADGSPTGNNDFRISDMGPEGNTSFRATDPAVVYNQTSNQYLVVWRGEDGELLPIEEFDIYGQVLLVDGTEVGDNDFRISDMGPDGDAAYQAFNPAVAYNPTTNQYLVVWAGIDGSGSPADDVREIFGQLLLANGAETGVNDFPLSDMGRNGDTDNEPSLPAVVYSSSTSEYLVVWQGDDEKANLVDGEFEIFGQRLLADGTETGPNDFRLSDMGPDGDDDYQAENPALACQLATAQCLVVWRGNDDVPPLIDTEFEIFGQFHVLESDFSVYLPFVVKP